MEEKNNIPNPINIDEEIKYATIIENKDAPIELLEINAAYNTLINTNVYRLCLQNSYNADADINSAEVKQLRQLIDTNLELINTRRQIAQSINKNISELISKTEKTEYYNREKKRIYAY